MLQSIKLFWTVKVAGVSGVGKTTILKKIESSSTLKCRVVTYSMLLQKFGSEELADYELTNILNGSTGLIIMDDHLEFDNPKKTQNYVKENTKGLILLDSPARMLIDRIEKDPIRHRIGDEKKICADLEVSRKKAMELSRELSMPLLVVPNLDGQIDFSVNLVNSFLKNIKP